MPEVNAFDHITPIGFISRLHNAAAKLESNRPD